MESKRGSSTTEAMNEEQKKRYEARIAENFLLALGGGWVLADQPGPPAADCLIQRSEEYVAVELACYRQQGIDNEVHEANWGFKSDVHNSWLNDPNVNETTLYIAYGMSGCRPRVPKPAQRPAVLQELKRLACDEAFFGAEEIEVSFLPGIDADIELPGPPAWRSVGTSRYPALAENFNSVHLHRHPGVRVGLPGTSLDSMYIGLDRVELRRILTQKSQKLPEYRAQGHDVWIVVHSDGWPGSSMVPAPHFDDALAIAAEQLLEFDAAYWLNEALAVRGATLHRIPSP